SRETLPAPDIDDRPALGKHGHDGQRVGDVLLGHPNGIRGAGQTEPAVPEGERRTEPQHAAEGRVVQREAERRRRGTDDRSLVSAGGGHSPSAAGRDPPRRLPAGRITSFLRKPSPWLRLVTPTSSFNARWTTRRSRGLRRSTVAGLPVCLTLSAVRRARTLRLSLRRSR